MLFQGLLTDLPEEHRQVYQQHFKMAPTVHHLLDQAGRMWVCTTASPAQSMELSKPQQLIKVGLLYGTWE